MENENYSWPGNAPTPKPKKKPVSPRGMFRRIMLIAVTVVLFKKIVRHPLGVIACVLILGGGIGNMIDRIMLGYVVDMFDLLLFDYPVFNLADCFVVVGAILGSIYYLWLYDKYDAKKKETPDGAEDPASDK